MRLSLDLWSCALLLATGIVEGTEGRSASKHQRRQPNNKEIFPNSSTSTTTTLRHLTKGSLNISLSTSSQTSSFRFTSSTSESPLPSSVPSATDNFTLSLSTLTNLPPSTLNASTISVACDGTVTYTGSAPDTVYLTITQGYDVTLTAANASFTAPPLLITPASACSQTILPDTSTILASSLCRHNCPDQNSIGEPGATLPPSESEAISTVYVTKKTPVPVIQQTTTPPPVYHLSSSTSSKPKPPSSTTRPSAPPQNTTPANKPPPSQTPGGGSIPPKSTSAPIVHTTAPANIKTPSITPVNPPVPNVHTSGPSPVSIGDAPSAPGASQTTQHTGVSSKQGSEKPVSSGGVPISVMPSSVVIGGQLVPIPTASAGTTLLVDGKTYTVKPSVIIGPDTTIPIGPTLHAQQITTPGPAFIPKTVAGLTFSVGSTQAVISGKTYTIGPGAKPTTIVVGGNTISIGSNGVGFASTTISPVTASSGPYSVVTADGLTFSVDHSEAVISGTTYKLGPGASARTTVVNGHTISIGPSGLGLATTTVSPPAVLPTGTAAGSTSPGTMGTGGAARMSLRGVAGLLVAAFASVALLTFSS